MQPQLSGVPHVTPHMTPEKAKWIVICCAIYLALPIDMIPIVGFIGDLTAFFVALNAVKGSLPPRQEA